MERVLKSVGICVGKKFPSHVQKFLVLGELDLVKI